MIKNIKPKTQELLQIPSNINKKIVQHTIVKLPKTKRKFLKAARGEKTD